MKNTIKLAPGLSFPAAEFATEVVASLANRGGGKSNGAAVIAEELLAAGVPVVVLDYVGIWFSLRLMADGKTPSPFQIPVLGGIHGDIDLLPTTGALVAEALAEKQSSAVLDISAFSKGDVRLITDAGLQALGPFDPLPEGAELAAHWIREVGGGASRMLQALVDAYPNALTYAELGERAGISAGSGTFSNYLSRLRALELVTGRGEVRASEELV